MDIINRLESHNEYCMSADTRQLLKDSASRIRELEHQVAELEALIRLRASEKMQRRVA